MSLPNQISTVNIVIDPSGTPTTHTFEVTDLDIPTSMKFWEGRTGLSITGKRRRKNIIRGFDRKLTFKFNDIRNQESTITDLIDDLKVATDNDYEIRFNVDGDTDYIFLVPSDAIYNQNYVNQIRRTPTTIEFDLAQIQNDTGYQGATS